MPEKLKHRRCKFCSSEFQPQRSNQIYCGEKHRELARYFGNQDELVSLHTKWCMWCGEKFISDRQNARFCCDKCRKQAFGAKPCKYCGETADTRDHFIPQAFVFKMESLGWIVKGQIMVPCCRECNSTAGDRVFSSISEKRKYIHERYRIKYRKLIESPKWTPQEIIEIGPSLQSHIKYSAYAKEIIMARLRWPSR